MTPDGTAPPFAELLREALGWLASDFEKQADPVHAAHLYQQRDSFLGRARAALASPGPRREPPPERWLVQAQAASESATVSRDVLRHFLGVALKELAARTEHERVVVAADTQAIVNLRAQLDAVGRVPLTEPRLAELLYECPDLWTAGDTDPQDREIYALAAKWLLPRLAGVSVPVSPPTEGPPTDMTRDELLDDALGRPVTPTDAPDAPPSLTEREAVLEVIDGAFAEIARICRERWNGTGDWRTSIPARPEWDSDLILGDALLAARNFIRSVGASRPGEPQP